MTVAALSLPLLSLSVAVPLPTVAVVMTLLSLLSLTATHQPVVELAIVLRYIPLLIEPVSFLPVVGVGGI
jgi:hypothetical protein